MKNDKKTEALTTAMLMPVGHQKITNTKRVQKHERQRQKTSLEINRGIVGESIEIMLERIREGEGEEAISDRDLVYNDNESTTVNPLTNIRSDKMELMLEEKIGEYEHKHKKAPMKVVKDEDEKDKSDQSDKSEGGDKQAKE